MIELDPARIAEFGRILSASPRRRIDQKTLWAAFASAFPGRPQGIEERRWLTGALEQLSNQGIVRLPAKSGKRWDKSLGAPLPMSVDLPAVSAPSPPRSWRSFPWHTSLSWVTELRHLPSDQEKFLLKIHEGLVNEWFREQAPLKYRSLQLTGSEKRLAMLLRTPLFGDGRLSLNLLGSYSELLPLAWASVGDTPRAIVFENAGPFFVARSVLSKMGKAPYGVVAYGGGKGLLASLPHIATIERSIEAIHYVGDLDKHGLEIANAARKIADANRLPPLSAAPLVHQRMLEAAARLGMPNGWPASRAPGESGKLGESIAFLPEDVRIAVTSIIGAGRRIPEEVLGPAELTSLWLSR